ncbi:hydroxycarboxylic acid receptor 2-like [Myxocyprinus asiaticus]|uniref:hydroxycarboxylic acid receptor 2-like n=1 Tax=Myxocyprinus asiaticus TaxID=70543 RepID=UPI002222BBAA|nr:hydroxycarboxylic acid receptor 2-like [Myxocyprinus asiaticus]
MNKSSVKYNTPEASTNSTTHSIGLMNSLDIGNMCLYSINFLFGLPAHSYVIWLIVRGTGIASGFFSLNLSVCEIGNCLNSLFSVVSIWFKSLSTFAMFLSGLVFTGRPLFQCLICVERYLAVVHPVTFLKFKPLRYRVICSTAAWIITLGACLFCMFCLVSLNMYAQTWFYCMQFLSILFIQLFCLLAVLRALKQSGPGERGRERGEENHMKRRAFYIILITTVNMVILYLPFIISGLFVILTKQYIEALWLTGLISYVLAGFVQPVLYLHCAGKLPCLCSP